MIEIGKRFKVRHQSTNRTYRCTKENENTYFVFAQRKRKYGKRYIKTEFDKQFIILEEPSETEQWHKRINTVIQKIKKTGLWEQFLPELENLLTMTAEDFKDIQQSKYDPDDETRLIQKYQTKYPFLFRNDNHGNPTLRIVYLSDFYWCKLKTMYFGKAWNHQIKEEFQKALEEHESYSSPRIRTSYDVKLTYDAGKARAWYSEEYKNCSNGHYYFALDANTAWYCETD